MKRPAKKSISRRIRHAEVNAPSEPRLTASELKAIAERILKFSEADETEVEIDVTTDALTRFANNIIHQNVAEQVLHISVRAVMDGRTARATTNKTDEESLRRVMAAAEKLALHQPKIPGLLSMLGPQKIPRVHRFFATTAEATPQGSRARRHARCKLAEKNKQTAAGIFSSGAMQTILANSKGLFAHHEQTRSDFSVTILEPNSSGWAKANSPDIRDLDPDRLAERASRKAADSASTARARARPVHHNLSLPPSWSCRFSVL